MSGAYCAALEQTLRQAYVVKLLLRMRLAARGVSASLQLLHACLGQTPTWAPEKSSSPEPVAKQHHTV